MTKRSRITPQSSADQQWTLERWQYSWKPREEPGIMMLMEVFGEEGKEKDTTKTARRQRETSLHRVKQEVTDVTELQPLIRVEDTDDQRGLHAVSDSSLWMSVCPMTSFMKAKSVLDSGATDSCAPDLHVSRGEE